MIDPIRITGIDEDSHTVTAALFFAVAVPAQNALGQPWAPTPSASFPQVVRDGYTGTEAADLDAGLEVGRTFPFRITGAWTPANIIAEIRARYAQLLAGFPAWYAKETATFQYIGAKIAAS